MRCILVRHPPLAVSPGTCYGRLDFPWSAAGVARATEITRMLASKADRPVWSSPSARCRDLALKLTPAPIVEPNLLELHFGDWEGRRWDDIPRHEIDRWAADPARIAPPGGETGDALLARVRSVADALLIAEQDMIVILHGGPLKLLRALLAGEPPDLLAPTTPPGSVIEVDIQTTASAAISASTADAPSTSPV